MSAIAGIAQAGRKDTVYKMLYKMAHRGPAGCEVREINGVTLGVAWTESQDSAADQLVQNWTARDFAGNNHFASAQAAPGNLTLKRDPIGVAPLYYGTTSTGTLCFASEVKAMLIATKQVKELPPGTTMKNGKVEPYYRLEKKEPLQEPPKKIASELRKRLENSVKKCIKSDRVGSWLSGGLDSSALASLAKSYVRTLYTFAVGYANAPDLKYARMVAEKIGSKHHELVVSNEEIVAILPDVIYHLESFDALLVRSSITNYLVARLASDYVPSVFSGEGADELFAGYDYIKKLDTSTLDDELIDITSRLHNTALQRVDRSASGNGTVAHVGFLDNDVVDYALRIPIQYKLNGGVEKWILRQAIADKLPEPVLERNKAKFWEGAGVQDHLEQLAEEMVSDRDFKNQHVLPNGWRLNSKEEMHYYRFFNEHFGNLDHLSWMGRTKGAPVN